MVRLVIMVRVHVVIAVGAAVFVVVSVRVVVVDPCRMRVLMAVDERAVAVFVGVHVGVLGVGVAKCRHWLQGIDPRCRIRRRGRQVTSVLMMPTAAQASTIGMTPIR